MFPKSLPTEIRRSIFDFLPARYRLLLLPFDGWQSIATEMDESTLRISPRFLVERLILARNCVCQDDDSLVRFIFRHCYDEEKWSVVYKRHPYVNIERHHTETWDEFRGVLKTRGGKTMQLPDIVANDVCRDVVDDHYRWFRGGFNSVW